MMNKLPIILGAISIFCILLSIIIYYNTYQSDTPIVFSSEATVAGEMAEPKILVDIEGAVEKPGVYTIALGSRIEDAIAAAGGLSAEADLEKIALTINRATKVVDTAKILIPKIGDLGNVSNLSNVSDLVNVNSATQSQLEALPGIGEATAVKIINGRPYQTLDELVSRKILFKSTFEKIKDQMTL